MGISKIKRDRRRSEYFWFKIGHFLFKISCAEKCASLQSRSVKRCRLLRKQQSSSFSYNILYVALSPHDAVRANAMCLMYRFSGLHTSVWHSISRKQSRWKDPPHPPAGGPHVCSGASCYVWKFFSSFLMFSKYLWRYSCIMKSTRELEAPRQARSQGWGVRWVHKQPPLRQNGPPCWVPVLLSAQERAGTWLSLKSML